MRMTRTFASLFSGGGGADMGAIAAGFCPIWGVEANPDIAFWRDRNLPGVTLVDRVENVDYGWLESPHVLWASPPCTEFSEANKNGAEGHSELSAAEGTRQAIAALRPPFFFLENVPAYRRSRSFALICEALDGAGYSWNAGLMNASDYGVPQNRSRLILRASLSGFPPSLPPVSAQKGWHGAISDLLADLPDSELPLWQSSRLGPLFETAFVPGHGSHSVPRPHGDPCPTITGSSGGRERAFLFNPVCRTVRLSDRCLARLQTFPDTYELPANRTLAGMIIGNAVPCLLAQRLLEGIPR